MFAHVSASSKFNGVMTPHISSTVVLLIALSGLPQCKAQVGGTGGLGGTAGQGGGGAAGGTAGAGGGGGAGAAGGGGGSAGGGGAGGQGGGGFGVLGVLNRAGFSPQRGITGFGGGGFFGRQQGRQFRQRPFNVVGAGGREGRIFPFQSVSFARNYQSGIVANLGGTGGLPGASGIGGQPTGFGGLGAGGPSLPIGNMPFVPTGASLQTSPGLVIELQNGKSVKPWKDIKTGSGTKAFYLSPPSSPVDLQTLDLGNGIQVTYGR